MQPVLTDPSFVAPLSQHTVFALLNSHTHTHQRPLSMHQQSSGDWHSPLVREARPDDVDGRALDPEPAQQRIPPQEPLRDRPADFQM